MMKKFEPAVPLRNKSFNELLNTVQSKMDPLHQQPPLDLTKKVIAYFLNAPTKKASIAADAVASENVDNINALSLLYPNAKSNAATLEALDQNGEFTAIRQNIDEMYNLIAMMKFNSRQSPLENAAFRRFSEKMKAVGFWDDLLQRRHFIALTINPDVAICSRAIQNTLISGASQYVKAIKEFVKENPRNELVSAATTVMKTCNDCEIIVGFDASRITRDDLLQKHNELSQKAIRYDIIQSREDVRAFKDLELANRIDYLKKQIDDFEAKPFNDNLNAFLSKYQTLLDEKQSLARTTNWSSAGIQSPSALRQLPNIATINSYEKAQDAIKLASEQIDLMKRNQKSTK
jgi:hypothetical protein